MKITAFFKNSLTVTLTLAIAIYCATALFANPLDDAKKKGIVTEKPDGYLEWKGKEGEIIARDINRKRAEAYESISKKTGVPKSRVAREAAAEARRR